MQHVLYVIDSPDVYRTIYNVNYYLRVTGLRLIRVNIGQVQAHSYKQILNSRRTVNRMKLNDFARIGSISEVEKVLKIELTSRK